MKKLNAILVLIALVACCFSCKKDPDVNDGLIKISDDKTFSRLGDSVSASFAGSYSYSGIIKRIELSISLDEPVLDNDNSDTYHARLNDKDFSVKDVRLIADTVYYYRYIVYRYSEEFDKETVWLDSIRVLTTKDLQFVPLVKTVDVNSITLNSAIGIGQVIDDGGTQILERGLCWSSAGSIPTITDNHISDGVELGEFSLEMKNLSSGTKYFMCAYAQNSVGYGYGDVISFTTSISDYGISVITLDVTDVTSNSATFNGKAVFNQDGSYSSAGFLWGGTEATVNVAHVSYSCSHTGGFGTWEAPPFTYRKSFLNNNSTYYVRAYVVEKGTGDTIKSTILKSFTTLASSQVPTGELNGAFSVSPTLQVQFSSGNLQYQASTNTWRFAENQWDYVGESNTNISPTYNGWIDLFCWGTSGYDHGAVCYQPWSTSETPSDYYAYGLGGNNLFDQNGQADWGYNAIINGGNKENSGWRTLTHEEWAYLFEDRNTATGIRYSKAQVNGINGVILLPDDWNATYYSLNNTNQAEVDFISNTINISQWTALEEHGAVFLPVTGSRYGESYSEQNSEGCYWSSSCYFNNSEYLSYFIGFIDANFGCDYIQYPNCGQSVRLVRSCN